MSDPYAIHRAQRALERESQRQRQPRFRRAGSVLESETDFGDETSTENGSSFGGTVAESYAGYETSSAAGQRRAYGTSDASGRGGEVKQTVPERSPSYEQARRSGMKSGQSSTASKMIRQDPLVSVDLLRKRIVKSTPSTNDAEGFSADRLRSQLSSSTSSMTSSSLLPGRDTSPVPTGGITDRLKSHDAMKGERRQLVESTLDSALYDSPLRRFARTVARLDPSSSSFTSATPGKHSASRKSGVAGRANHGLLIGLIGVVGIKWLVGVGGYSGKRTPPLFGDFEAQRHWMELTANLPIKEWYGHGEDWWQLDYPPLTAYVSWIFGRIGFLLHAASFELFSSRGIESPFLTTYMRSTVLALELVSWFPAVVAYVWYNLGPGSHGRSRARSRRTKLIAVMTILLWPGVILIDNGHFQYNSFMLALTLLSVLSLQSGHDLIGCVAFSLSLGFKQMALYYSPVVFGYLVGKCLWLGGSAGLLYLIKIAAVTSATFAIMFAPFLTPFPKMPLLVLHRMFPLARGIFEDKVANFWCASNVVFKWRNHFAPATMAKMATAMTLLAFTPTLILLIYSGHKLRNRRRSGRSTPASVALLPTAMLSTSLSFFLYSFQVHEKSILIPMMWTLVIMALERGGGDTFGKSRKKKMAEEQIESENIWSAGVLLLNVSVFSMFPLLKKDDQVLQYVVMQLLWSYLIGYDPRKVGDGRLRATGYVILPVIAVHHILEYTIPAPARFPDIFTVTNVLLSTAVFGLAWLWANARLVHIALRLEIFDLNLDVSE